MSDLTLEQVKAAGLEAHVHVWDGQADYDVLWQPWAEDEDQFVPFEAPIDVGGKVTFYNVRLAFGGVFKRSVPECGWEHGPGCTCELCRS